jgi:hypothetical protein
VPLAHNDPLAKVAYFGLVYSATGQHPRPPCGSLSPTDSGATAQNNTQDPPHSQTLELQHPVYGFPAKGRALLQSEKWTLAMSSHLYYIHIHIYIYIIGMY